MIWGRAGKKKPRGALAAMRGDDGPLSARQRGLRALVLFLALVVLVAMVTKRLTPESDEPLELDIRVGTYAPETVKALLPFRTEDLDATRRAREAAEAAVPYSYEVDRDSVARQLAQFDRCIDALGACDKRVMKAVKQALMGSNSAQPREQVVGEALVALAQKLIEEDEALSGFPDPALLAVWLWPSAASIPERQFEETAPTSEGGEAPKAVKSLTEPLQSPMTFAHLGRLADLARHGLEFALNYGVVEKSTLSAAGPDTPERTFVLHRDQPFGEQAQSESFASDALPLHAKARQLLYEEVARTIQEQTADEPEPPVDWGHIQNAACEMAALSLGETIVFDNEATMRQMALASSEVEPVLKEIAQNQAIQWGGEPWTEQSLSDYRTYQALMRSGERQATSLTASLFAHVILVGLALACLHRWLFSFGSGRHPADRGLYLALLMMCAVLIVGRVAILFDPTGFVVPVAACAILLAILMSPRDAAITGLLTAGLLSIQYDYSWRLLMVSSAMVLGGVLSIFTVRRRTDMGSAAFKAACVGVLTLLAIRLGTESLFSEATLRPLALIGLNGFACLLIVPGLLLPLERLFGITTDIQLLEYSDLNNEVLSRLAIEVPATHAHSQRLGDLAEAAARAIGANGLLARVCAYYHDVGKLRRPEYFSENQTEGNIHDGLPPRLSARAIASHVLDGVELARDYRLPQPIVDGILEHHGTSLISFFYQEALAQQKHGDIREEDFRYPGPKPQGRETAILMICDAVESGVRSIKNPNEERVRDFIDKIIKGRAADGQFDECDLTLKDLGTIRDVVTKRVLTGMHRRVSYPDPVTEGPARNVIPLSGGRES